VSVGSGRGGFEADPYAALDRIRRSLPAAGLLHRHDVVVELNGREVALGFSRSDCDGLLLVAVLPHTAQGWTHLAPRLDLSAFDRSYLYDGLPYRAVPRLERLANRLAAQLRPGRPTALPQVVAIAEAGNCGLTPSVAPALELVSRG